jgi:putative transposase
VPTLHYQQGSYDLNVKVPKALRVQAKGRRVSLPVAGERHSVMIGEKAVLSLRIKDPETAKTRFRLLAQALGQYFEAIAKGPQPLTRLPAETQSDDVTIRERLKTLAGQRRRFGYRRLHILLRRGGVVLNHKKLFRLYREERLTVRRRGGRKRALGTRAPMAMPQGLNQRWSLDFVADQLVDGRRFRVLVVVDDFTRECLALVVDTSLSGQRVARELDALIALRGRPLMVVSDNGTKLTSRAILQWQEG